MNTFNHYYPAGVPMFPLYGYDNSEDLDNDMDYLKSMYPSKAKSIQKEVEEECDKLEYDGSCMFDAYPDKVHLSMIVNTIYNRLADLDQDNMAMSVENQNLQRRYPFRPDLCPHGRCPSPGPICDFDCNGRPNWMRSLIEIMLYNEMFNRRRRYRSRKRWF